MTDEKVNGDQALAYGAIAAGVKIVTSYPGSPSSGTVETLIDLAARHQIYVEWSSNEKVAMEMGIGASIAGRRALVCTKSVGMNAMLDPLMVLNLTPVNGGLVILLGDDPGGYGSQNDQDTRLLAPMLEIPMMEPSSPAEGYAMMRQAFGLSERFAIPVIIRVTRSFTQQVEVVATQERPDRMRDLSLAREPWRFVPVPQNVVQKHRDLHQRLQAVSEWADRHPFNQIWGDGDMGIIGVGFAYRKLRDVIGAAPHDNLRLFKLSTLYPLPKNLIASFLRDCQRALVFEETEPYIETQIKAIAQDIGCPTRIFGQQVEGGIGREGELFRWQIQQSIAKFMPHLIADSAYIEGEQSEKQPEREDHCASCDYGPILDVLDEAAASMNQKLVLIGDPGCLVKVADRLVAKYAIGSAVAVADGISKAGIRERAVALFGDSSFFHTSLAAICNAVHNQSDILMIVFDNGATASTGFQPNAGGDRDALGRPAPALNIEHIARACGVTSIKVVNASDRIQLGRFFEQALRRRDLTLIVVRTEC